MDMSWTLLERTEVNMNTRWTAVAAFAAAIVASPVAAQGNTSQAGMATKDIVGVAVEAGSFKTLVAAVQAAGLVETLQGEGPFTVFAPTDEAFAKLPAGTVEALLADREKLIAVLTYHVVAGRIASRDVVQAGSARPQTVQGEMLDVRVDGQRVLVDGAQVVAADIQATNGVIHVIDTVVLPKSMMSGTLASR
jgi:uncharacterized surface protein with fasciclin (FAS1) repeats